MSSQYDHITHYVLFENKALEGLLLIIGFGVISMPWCFGSVHNKWKTINILKAYSYVFIFLLINPIMLTLKDYFREGSY